MTVTVSAPTTGSSLPPIDVSGTLTANTTWSPNDASAYIIDDSLDVPSGITLTIEPGTVVKGNGSISVEGTLDAVGTTTSPITFTSVNDNSVGGTTGSGSPADGDWAGISVDGGSIDLERSRVDYAITGVGVTNASSSVTIVSNAFASILDDAVYIEKTPSPTVEDNRTTDVGAGPFSDQNAAFEISYSSIDPGLLSGNSASGGYPFFVLGIDQVAVSATMLWVP